MFVKIIDEKDQIAKDEQVFYIENALRKYGSALDGIEINIQDNHANLQYFLRSPVHERVKRVGAPA